MTSILFIWPHTDSKLFAIKNGLVEQVIRKRSIVAPPTLPTLAAMTPARFDVTLLDEDFETIDFDRRYDIVALTGLGVHVPHLVEIAQEYKRRGQFLVAGGIGVGTYPERLRPWVDVLFFGECEEAWPRFLADFEAGAHADRYDGGAIDMATSPVPRWDLMQVSQYLIGTVQGSRGCPFNCEFCNVVSLFGRVARLKPIGQIMTEVDNLARLGVRQIFLSDDNFYMNPRHTKALLRELIAYNDRRDEPLRFSTQITIDSTRDDELYDLLTAANFTQLFIGLESPSADALASTDKKHNLKVDIVDAVRRIHARGIIVLIGGTIGFETDGPEIFDTYDRFLVACGIAGPGIGLLTAWKGTRLWKRIRSEGRLLEDRPEFEFGITNFHPARMSLDELEVRFVDFMGNTVASWEHFFRVLDSYLGALDPALVNPRRNKTALTRANLSLLARFLRYTLWTKGDEGRRALATTLRIALRHGSWTLPWAIEALTQHLLRREFTLALPAYRRLMREGRDAALARVSHGGPRHTPHALSMLGASIPGGRHET